MPYHAVRLCCTHDGDNSRKSRRPLPPSVPRLPGLAAAWATHTSPSPGPRTPCVPLPPPGPCMPLLPMSCPAVHAP
ncbi:hypothetical protein E2562_028268 [Oryza meyeriana var. granulata]|uniref:Uncharacterized protein n=1 Tax=Oryza meyeriana var. granulata TaxID=110450 RepID=A0A6G1E1Q7_9ORYZ|nr:hypothetical protein E2562_028268 [Oryza meyeriana var. granulata]